MLLKKSRLLAGNTARESGRLFWELKLTEGRGTDLPIIYDGMKKNGSSAQAFETDEHRNYFLQLSVHPLTNFVLVSRVEPRKNSDKKKENQFIK